MLFWSDYRSYFHTIQGSQWLTVNTSLTRWNQNPPPSSSSCAWNWPSNSKLASEGCVYFLKFYTMRQPEKVGTVSSSSDTGTTHVTLVKVPCCQLSYIPYVFKHCDLQVLKIIILWEAGCITPYSQNPNTTFEIRFFTHGLWRAGSSEHRVVPSKLMKRGWKYPLKHYSRRGWRCPLER